MLKSLSKKPALVGAGFVMGLLVGLGMLAGALVAVGYHHRSSGLELPETLLHATATHGADTFAVATGAVSDEAEGVFFLDFLTGELQCWVLYPRTGAFGAKFTTNVMKDLGADQGKKPSYLMVTGMAAFQRGAGVAQPALSVVYVVDSNTGNFAAYSLPWNRNAERSGTPQAGGMVTVGTGKARSLELRD